MALQEWQQRVVDERTELAVKMDKLSQFLISIEAPNATSIGMTEHQSDLLYLQLDAMRVYYRLLGMRVLLFLKKVPN